MGDKSQEGLSAERLCALTGLTDRRHRQLAKEGYFPPPIKGVYQLTPTITGMFRYYREYNQRLKSKKEAIDDEKHRKLKLENDEAEGMLTNTVELCTQIAPMLMKYREIIYSSFEIEAPRAMAGIGLAEARIVGRRMADDLLTGLQNIFRSIATPK